MCRQCMRVALLSLCVVPCALAESQPKSAMERAQCKFEDHTEATVVYVGMRMKGRKIFGGVVPYGRIWETGYKGAPTFVAGTDLMIGGKNVPAGRYSLSTIPNPDKWTMIVKKMTGEGDLNGMVEVARIDLNAKRLPSPLERFTISFDQWKGGCVLNLRWEETEASVLLAERSEAPPPNMS